MASRQPLHKHHSEKEPQKAQPEQKAGAVCFGAALPFDTLPHPTVLLDERRCSSPAQMPLDALLCILNNQQPSELFAQVKRLLKFDNLSETHHAIMALLWMMDVSTRHQAFLTVVEMKDEGKLARGLSFFDFNFPCRLQDSKHHKSAGLSKSTCCVVESRSSTDPNPTW